MLINARTPKWPIKADLYRVFRHQQVIGSSPIAGSKFPNRLSIARVRATVHSIRGHTGVTRCLRLAPLLLGLDPNISELHARSNVMVLQADEALQRPIAVRELADLLAI